MASATVEAAIDRAAPAELAPCTLTELLLYFLRLGTTGFGGPIALVGYMQRDLVEQRRWISRQDYVEGLALAQLAPGPLAAQLAIYLEWVRGGVTGATLVGAPASGGGGGRPPAPGVSRVRRSRRVRLPARARQRAVPLGRRRPRLPLAHGAAVPRRRRRRDDHARARRHHGGLHRLSGGRARRRHARRARRLPAVLSLRRHPRRLLPPLGERPAGEGVRRWRDGRRDGGDRGRGLRARSAV